MQSNEQTSKYYRRFQWNYDYFLTAVINGETMRRDLRDAFLAHFKPLIATLNDQQKDLLAEAVWQLGLECLPAKDSQQWAEQGKRGTEITLFQFGAGIRSTALAITRIVLNKQLTEERRTVRLPLPFGEDGPR